MRLYNTLTRTVEELEPLLPPVVSVYTCGPTVYDYPHVGNWFTFIRYDVLVRTMRANNLQPKWVMNITDVGHLVSDADEGEDKLEKGAQRESKTAWEVAKQYTDYFVEGLDRLNINSPDVMPKATEHIPEQISLIEALHAKGFTYIIDDGVYFDTSKFVGYDRFAQLDLDDLQAGARVEVNPQKRNHTDFALWKLSPKGFSRDMEWDSPWGKGFPGWHLECSAMSMKYLGETIDVHSGGIDHIPVHHTNEIAQSEAATGKRFANYWMHTNHISVNGEKISKSLGNSITLEDLEAKGFTLEAFRLHVLESHYRSQSKFSWESLEAAQNRLSAYQFMADQQWQPMEKGSIQPDLINLAKERISQAAQNDLRTPEILVILSELATAIDSGGITPECQVAFKEFLQWLDDLLGLTLSQRPDINTAQADTLAARQAARMEQNWSQSDSLRASLNEQGIEIRDTSYGQIWFRP